MEFEARQIAIGHKQIWDALTEWAGQRNLRLVPMPLSNADDLPTWYFAPTDLPLRNNKS